MLDATFRQALGRDEPTCLQQVFVKEVLLSPAIGSENASVWVMHEWSDCLARKPHVKDDTCVYPNKIDRSRRVGDRAAYSKLDASLLRGKTMEQQRADAIKRWQTKLRRLALKPFGQHEADAPEVFAEEDEEFHLAPAEPDAAHPHFFDDWEPADADADAGPAQPEWLVGLEDPPRGRRRLNTETPPPPPHCEPGVAVPPPAPDGAPPPPSGDGGLPGVEMPSPAPAAAVDVLMVPFEPRAARGDRSRVDLGPGFTETVSRGGRIQSLNLRCQHCSRTRHLSVARISTERAVARLLAWQEVCPRSDADAHEPFGAGLREFAHADP